jgi:riboflavin biosynthesis pyrimidine reductase
MQLRRLHPGPGAVEAAHALDELDLAAGAPADRPRVVLNMVASVDGRAALHGRSAPLSGPADRELFHALRGRVDAVLAGTATLRAERYGRLVRDPARRAARAARGLAPDPLAVVLSRSGDVPEDVPLLTDPAQPAVVLRGAQAEPRRALRALRAEHGVRSLLCEGGGRLNGGLLDAGVVDELFLTLSPLLAGGDAAPIVEGGPTRALELLHVLEHGGALFLRYRVKRGRTVSWRTE